ncbi:FAD-binding oxidoreductase [soil metagenome]
MASLHVAIVGAGIVGASCAYFLSERGARVTVLERAGAPASGSTAKSAAGLRHQFSHPENVKMSLFSAGMFGRFETLTGYDAGYRKVGYLFLIPEHLSEAWTAQREMQSSLGARVESLDLRETAARFPYLDLSGLAGSSFGPDDGVVDPHAVTLGFLAAARANGAKVVLETEVLGLERQGSGWRLETSRGTFEADAVLNAAGAFGGELGTRAGLAVPVLPYRRTIYATAPVPDFAHPTPLVIDLSTGVYLRSEGERFIFGLSNEHEPPGANEAIDWAWLEHTLGLALPRFPFLETVGLDRKACWAGLYEITPDHLHVLGRMPDAEAFYNACGFSGHGVQHAPASGLILSEEILDGAAHSFDITDFRIERFKEVRARGEANIV